MNRLRTFVFSAAAAALATFGFADEASAYCTRADLSLAFQDSDTGQIASTVFVYLNDGQASMARTGLPIDAVEDVVRAMIVRYNESSAGITRLVYGGRVQNDTVIRGQAPTDISQYIQDWQAANPGRPLGITVQGVTCQTVAPPSEQLGAIARAEVVSGQGYATVSFSPYQDDQGTICPRGGTKINCLGTDNVPAGDPCQTDETCTCTDGQGQISQGVQECLDNQYRPCECTARGYEAYNLGDGTAPAGHGDCDDLGPADTKDLFGVMMHEVGHLVGLDHTSIDNEDDCSGEFMTGGTIGVMDRASYIYQTGKGRRLRLDDLLGLEEYYSADPSYAFPQVEPIFGLESLDNGTTWTTPFPVPVPVTGTMVHPSVSSTVELDDFQVVGYVGPSGTVMHATRDVVTWHPLTASQAQVPGPGNKTRDPVAVAVGGGRMAVAWIDENTTDLTVNIRWAIRDASNQSPINWVTGDLETSLGDNRRPSRKELGLGYDEASGSFILTTLRTVDSTNNFPSINDGKAFIIFIDPANAGVRGNQVQTQAEILDVIGKAACHLPSGFPFTSPVHCATAVGTMESDRGARLGILYFGSNGDPQFPIVSTMTPIIEEINVRTFGAVDIAAAGLLAANQPFLASLTTPAFGDPNAFVLLRLLSDIQLGASPASPHGVINPDNADFAVAPEPPSPIEEQWPVAVGSRYSGTTSLMTIIRTGVFGVCGDGVVDAGEACDDANTDQTDDCLDNCEVASCGDGYIQAGVEQCDDGNAVDNDGCSSTCQVECGPGDDGEMFCPCRANDTCDHVDLSCKFESENSNEKLCLPCGIGGDGRGCPCNNAGTPCTPDDFDRENEDCWQHPESEWVCADPVPGWDPFGVPRCWDFNRQYVGLGFCTYGSGQNQCANNPITPNVCVGNVCEATACGDANGVEYGTCAAAGLFCDVLQNECATWASGGGQCRWPTIDGDAPNGCAHPQDWCPQP